MSKKGCAWWVVFVFVTIAFLIGLMWGRSAASKAESVPVAESNPVVKPIESTPGSPSKTEPVSPLTTAQPKPVDPSPKTSDSAKLTTTSVEGLSSCVVLDERYCEKLTLLLKKDGIPGSVNAVVGANIANGTPVYAPFDGYFDYGARIIDGDISRSVVFVYREKDRTREGIVSGQYTRVAFVAPEWEYKRNSNEFVKKGALIAVAKGEGGMRKATFGDNDCNLQIMPSRSLHDTAGSDSKDPFDYLRSFVSYAEQR